MILHIIPDEKWTQTYVEKVNGMFDPSQHVFVLFYKKQLKYCNKELSERFNNVFLSKGSIISNIHALKMFRASNMIILHSLLYPISDLLFILLFCKENLTWFLWGGDLYDVYQAYVNYPRNFIIYFRELLRKKIINKLSYVIANEGDYNQLKKWYYTNANRVFAQYSYKLLDKESIKNNRNNSDKKRVLVGHSATETCKHFDIYNNLSKYVGKIEVYSPLSYPDNEEYVKQVINVGSSIFGSDYYPITDYLNYDDYVTLLSSMDIGVFGNNRQQGNGNIINLLYLGKKVYVSKDNNLFDHYSKLGITLFEYPNFDDNLLDELPTNIALNNEGIIKQTFSDQSFFQSWKSVFDKGDKVG